MFKQLFLTFLVFAGIYTMMLFAIQHPFVAEANASPESSTMTTENQSDIYSDISQAFTVKGIAAKVGLDDNGQSVNKLWSKFDELDHLHNSVDWANGATLYAVYSRFNEDFTEAVMTIGYASEQVNGADDINSFVVPAGKTTRYSLNISTQMVENSAWEAAYLSGILIEIWTLNSMGNTVNAEAVVLDIAK